MRSSRKRVSYPKVNLPEAQMRDLLAIIEHIRRYRISPTYDEIAALVDRKKSSVRHTVRELLKKGLIARAQGSVRNIIVTELGKQTARRYARRRKK
jgi:Mn-dependent DtxR family transcriptional regulator